MMKIPLWQHVAVFVAIFSNTLAVADDTATQIDQLLQQYHDLGQINGSALVVDAGSIVISKGYGIANQSQIG